MGKKNHFFALTAPQTPGIPEGLERNKLLHMFPDESLISAGLGLRVSV